VQPPRFIDGFRRGNRQSLERVGHRLQVAPGEVEIQHASHGEHDRESPRRLRIGRLLDEVAPPQDLVEEESAGAHVQLHRAWCRYSLPQQVSLVRAQVRPREAIGGAPEVAGELVDVLDVIRDGRRGVLATVEFLQHRLSEMGHRHLLVTHTLPG
jgi:hypothetical protein